MIKVFQTDHGAITGNCMESCIASLFELNLNQVPILCAGEDGDNWHKNLLAWLKEKMGCYYLEFTWKAWDAAVPSAYCIIVGKSPRYPDTKHAVVGHGTKIVHDPVGMEAKGYMTLDDKENWLYGYFVPFDPMSFGDLFLERKPLEES